MVVTLGQVAVLAIVGTAIVFVGVALLADGIT
jgi:hypothetical protein